MMKNTLAGLAILVACCIGEHSGILRAQQPPVQAPAQAPAPDAATVLAGEYRLQVDDELTVKVFQHSEVDESVRVLPDGTISVPLANRVQAEGITVDELRKQLTKAYASYFRNPQVSVIVRTVANRTIFVGGEVVRPGLVPLSGRMTALRAVLQAGGFKPTAQTDSVYLIRNDGKNQAVASRLNLKEVFEKGKADQVLQSFDVVYVPMSKIAKVDKFVDQYLRQAIPVNLNAGFTYLFSPSSSVIRFQ